MKCQKSDTCANYGKGCSDCMVMSAPYDETPYYVEKGHRKVRFKTFFGNNTITLADVELNKWLDENPTVRVLAYQYQQARMGDHSICIMYEEKNNATENH